MSANNVAFPNINQERVLLFREYASRHGRPSPPPLIRIGLRLRGTLNVDILQAALDDLLCRHPALRTAFLENPNISAGKRERQLNGFARTGLVHSGLHMQFLLQDAKTAIREVDLCGLGHDDRQPAIQALLSEESSRAFNHGFPPLMRAILVRTSESEHLLILVVDHLVCDGVSVAIICRDFQALYAARVTQSPLALSDPLSSLEFAAWQQSAFSSPYFDRALEYWRTQWITFASARVSFEDLPFSLTPPAEPDLVFRTEHDQICPAEAETIRSLARQSRTTPFVVFLAAFALTLHRYTGKPRIAMWGHFANRKQDSRASAVGWFANSHILGIDFSSHVTGAEFLRHVREVVVEALSFQELPLPFLWQTTRCSPRFGDVTPLLDYRVIPRADNNSDESADRLQITRVDLPDSTTPRLSSLGVYLNDDRERIFMSLKFPGKRFPPEAIRQLLKDLVETALKLARNPAVKTSELVASEGTGERHTGQNVMSEFVLLDSSLIPAVLRKEKR